ncbi:putative stem-specific protein TSJT1 [Helianthus debilis subsp. tardiflorus]
MLGVFKNGIVSPPKELKSPNPNQSNNQSTPLQAFLSSHQYNASPISLGNDASLAYAHSSPPFWPHKGNTYYISLYIHTQMHAYVYICGGHKKCNTCIIGEGIRVCIIMQHMVRSVLYCSVDDVHCIFLGSLNNVCALNKQHALAKGTNEPMFVIQAYKTFRDRGPYPAHLVLKDLEGSFGFVVFDFKAKTVFISLSTDGRVKLYWGIAADGSIVISDNLEVIKSSCSKSFAPFPTGM